MHACGITVEHPTAKGPQNQLTVILGCSGKKTGGSTIKQPAIEFCGLLFCHFFENIGVYAVISFAMRFASLVPKRRIGGLRPISLNISQV